MTSGGAGHNGRVIQTPEQRLSAAVLSLEGLSIGDAANRERLADETHPWRYSDDPIMAMAIVDVLAAHSAIDQDALATAFAKRFERDPERGYGVGSIVVLSTGIDCVPAAWRHAREPLDL